MIRFRTWLRKRQLFWMGQLCATYSRICNLFGINPGSSTRPLNIFIESQFHSAQVDVVRMFLSSVSICKGADKANQSINKQIIHSNRNFIVEQIYLLKTNFFNFCCVFGQKCLKKTFFFWSDMPTKCVLQFCCKNVFSSVLYMNV